MVVFHHLVLHHLVDSYHSLVLQVEVPGQEDPMVHQARIQVHLEMEPQNLFGQSYLKMMQNLLSLETRAKEQEEADYLNCSHQLLASFLYFVRLRLELEQVQDRYLLDQTDTQKLKGSFHNVSLKYMPHLRKLQFLIVLQFLSKLYFLCTKIE